VLKVSRVLKEFRVLKVQVFKVLKEFRVLLVVVEVQSLIGYKQLQVFIHFLMLVLEPLIPQKNLLFWELL
jgi:hypothetical protein